MPDLKNLDVQWVSLVDRAAVRDPEDTSEPMRFLVWKREQAKGDPMPVTPEETRAALEKAEAERDELKGTLEKAQTDAEEQKAALDKAQTELKALTDKVAELTKGDPEGEPKKIDKSQLPDEVREQLEKAETERAEMAERLEKAEAATKAERDERVTKEFVAKADAYKALPVKADEFGPVLKAASEKLTADEFTALETALKAADEQIAESALFKEQGRDRGSEVKGALAEARQKAEELQKADPKLSDTAALDKALTADRALQERYLAEVRG